MASNEPILQVENVVAGYGEVLVLKGVTFDVHPGEIVCIIGANGAGKSTLLRTIFGLVKTGDGRIVFNGHEITNDDPVSLLKEGLSYVRQGRGNLPEMTVRENLEMGAYIRNDDAVTNDVEEMLDRFPLLREKEDEYAGNLSGGQQQILEIAMSLMLSPQLILIDEPSLGLAPIIAEDVFSTIHELNRDETTVLLVEQNAKKALTISDRGIVLELGKVHQVGSGQELLADEELRRHYLGG